MSKVPVVREKLLRIANELFDLSEYLKELADDLRRARPSRPRTAVKSKRITPELVAEIKETARKLPELSGQQIAIIHNVNHGRVSEVLSGKRG